MSMSELPPGSRYLRLKFDEDELDAIRSACKAVSMLDHYLMMHGPADVSLEDASRQAKKAGDSDMADGLASMFEPDQEILIVPEDVSLVLDSLRQYGRSAPEEHAVIINRIIEKIERVCREC